MFFSFLLSFVTGLLAALNPCVAPIYPIVFSYYLKKGSRISAKNLILFLIGFMSAFLLLAGLILWLGSISGIQEYIRFTAAGVIGLLGVHFLLVGLKIPFTLQQKLENIDSPLIFGMVFGLALNPCSLPLFMANTAITVANAMSWLNIIFFGIGIAIPPLMAAVFGSTLVKALTKRTRGAYQYLDIIVGVFLLVSSALLIWNLGATPITAVIASATILLFFLLLILPYWRLIFACRKERQSLIILSSFLIMLWGVITFHCHEAVFSTQFACGSTCVPCRICTSLLILTLVVGYLGFYFLKRIVNDRMSNKK